jgi:hypothetical protein
MKMFTTNFQANSIKIPHNHIAPNHIADTSIKKPLELLAKSTSLNHAVITTPTTTPTSSNQAIKPGENESDEGRTARPRRSSNRPWLQQLMQCNEIRSRV